MARDGAFWRGDDAGERYDLVVVGGGISGLSAAYFYPQAVGENARILVLDNARGDIPRSQRYLTECPLSDTAENAANFPCSPGPQKECSYEKTIASSSRFKRVCCVLCSG